MPALSKCRSCQKLVRFVHTRAGKWIPLDPDPVPDGSIVSGWDGHPRFLKRDIRQCRVCGCTELDACPDARIAGGGCSWVEQDLCSSCVGKEPRRYVSHFATCPDRKRFGPGGDMRRAVREVERRGELARAQGRTAAEGLAGPAHRCHALNCERPVEARFLMCPPHWRMVPLELQRRVWATYVPGQEVRKDPTAAYLEAAAAAIQAVAGKELARAEDRPVTGRLF